MKRRNWRTGAAGLPWVLAGALLAGSVGARAAADGTETTAAEVTMLAEVARLNASVERIAAALDQLLDRQGADLLMKRLELLQRALAPAQEELQRVRRSYEAAGEELESMNSQLELFEEEWEKAEATGTAPTEADRERMLADFGIRVELLTARQQRLYARIQEMENDLAGRRQDIAILEDLLDEKLDLR